VSRDGKYLYISPLDSRTVAVLDIQSDTVVGTLVLPTSVSAVGGLALSPDGTRLYAAAYDATSVSVFDTRTDKIVGNPIVIPQT
jgi:DNA-binding beta-propeller fold protein YncE